MDWNWFFSSIAQSAAAIVGIFGAFIITKVLSNQAKFGEKSVRFRSLRTDAAKLVDSANHLAFAWYVRLNREYELEEALDLLKNDGDLNPNQLYAKLNFPPFLARVEAIRNLQDLKDQRDLAEEEKRRRYEEALRQHVQQQKGLGQFGFRSSLGFSDRPPMFIEQREASPIRSLSRPWAELSKERNAIDALEVEVRHHMRMIVDFLATTKSNPESSMAITWALVMVASLFLIGVITL